MCFPPISQTFSVLWLIFFCVFEESVSRKFLGNRSSLRYVMNKFVSSIMPMISVVTKSVCVENMSPMRVCTILWYGQYIAIFWHCGWYNATETIRHLRAKFRFKMKRSDRLHINTAKCAGFLCWRRYIRPFSVLYQKLKTCNNQCSVFSFVLI